MESDWMSNNTVINIDDFKKKQVKKNKSVIAMDEESVGELYAQDLVEEFNKILQGERKTKNKDKK